MAIPFKERDTLQVKNWRKKMAKRILLFTANYMPHTDLRTLLLLSVNPHHSAIFWLSLQRKTEVQRTQSQSSWQTSIDQP